MLDPERRCAAHEKGQADDGSGFVEMGLFHRPFGASIDVTDGASDGRVAVREFLAFSSPRCQGAW